jgi:hypothetical protein
MKGHIRQDGGKRPHLHKTTQQEENIVSFEKKVITKTTIFKIIL